MRRLFLLSLFVLSVFSVQAQPKWGTWSVVPHVGVSFANLTNDAIHVADNRISHSQTRIGFSGGADVYYQLTDKLALSGGVAYTQAGCIFAGGTCRPVSKEWHRVPRFIFQSWLC